MNKIKIGISACLLGQNVRYDGGHQWDRYITDTLGSYFSWVPVCPEVEYGLSIPREAMRLVGDPATPRLVTVKSGTDHTEGMREWARKRLETLENEDLCGFIFKSKSPSSGMSRVKVYGPSGAPSRMGVGIFAKALMDRFPLLPVEEDGRLHDPILRENFIERIFVYHRWRHLSKQGMLAKDLVRFHSEHKLLIMSHSLKHMSALGNIIADTGKNIKNDKGNNYIKTLMDALRLMATTKKHANVLMHMMGYFKKDLSHDEKQELLDMIDMYRLGKIPLIVPMVLLSHYVRKFDQPYLKMQVYLNPHPLELMLRNHV
jgi:uncharacterized protein YbgA (DUF1722 family)/uncharacterized protein YbbK (DUF523 family)